MREELLLDQLPFAVWMCRPALVHISLSRRPSEMQGGRGRSVSSSSSSSSSSSRSNELCLQHLVYRICSFVRTFHFDRRVEMKFEVDFLKGLRDALSYRTLVVGGNLVYTSHERGGIVCLFVLIFVRLCKVPEEKRQKLS